MFPWVCLATMPLFYPFNWPKAIVPKIKMYYLNIKITILNICNITWFFQNNDAGDNVKGELHSKTTPNDVKDSPDGASDEGKVDEQVNEEQKDTKQIQKESITNIEMDKSIYPKKLTTFMIIIYVLMQAFLPFSHFITKVCN